MNRLELAELLTLGASTVGAIAAAAAGERLSLALLLVTGFWTAVRIARERAVL